GIGNYAASFIVQGYAALFAQAKGARPFGDPIDAEFGSELIKVGITGFDDRPMQIHRAMAAFFPIAKAPVTEGEEPRILNGAFRIDDSFFKRGDGHDDFECRSRRKLTLGGAI